MGKIAHRQTRLGRLAKSGTTARDQGQTQRTNAEGEPVKRGKRNHRTRETAKGIAKDQTATSRTP